MKSGFLNDYFKGVAVKRLVSGEINAMVSNQHEFNVNKSLLELFGKPEGKVRYNTKYLYLSDNNDELKEIDSTITWYDARENVPNRSEYRLYFPAPSVEVIKDSEVNDSLFLCLKSDGTLLLIIAKQDSTIENQLYYLFGLEHKSGGNFEKKCTFDNSRNQISFVVRTILEKIGIEYVDIDDKRIFENLMERFNGIFPSTNEFSQYARDSVENIDPVGNPDEALIRWYERETALFKMMEQHEIEQRLEKGFYNSKGVDVEGFIKYSLSVHNRRKARAGKALENGVSELLIQNGVLFDRTPITERKNQPDFLFPGKDEYHDVNFPVKALTMLGAKTTSKDRWRQVLDEADRIEEKHLITLESAISINQTNQMESRNLQLVVPSSIQLTYSEQQRKWLFSVADFIHLVKERQKISAKYSERVRLYFEKLGDNSCCGYSQDNPCRSF